MCSASKPHSVWRLVVLPFALVAAAGGGARADDDWVGEGRARRQGTLERKARAARQAAGELDLTYRQARRLLPLVEAAAALHVEAYEQEAKLLPEMLEAFSEFAREDAINEGFSPEVERRTSHLNHQAKELRERITAELIEIEEQVAQVLVPTEKISETSVNLEA